MAIKQWLLLACLLCMPLTALAQKTDIVILKNGDKVTGEVIKLEAGKLEFNTDTMGRVYIEWRHIADVISDKNHSVETTDGARWLGRLQKPEEGDNIVVNTVRGPVEMEPVEVVSVWPVKAGFWDRVDLEISVGLDYAKSTEITNFTSAVDFRHFTDDRITEASWRSDLTRQSSGDEQTRVEVRFDHQYLLPEQRFRTWVASMDSNEALEVDLRLSAGATFGKYFVKTNNQWFTVSGGAQAVQENPKGGSGETNIEAIGTVRYRFFRFAEPERNFDTTLSVYPSISEFGRVRTDLRSTFKLEFFKDLFWAMEFYHTHDNEPLVEDAEKTDYGITTSLGWSW